MCSPWTLGLLCGSQTRLYQARRQMLETTTQESERHGCFHHVERGAFPWPCPTLQLPTASLKRRMRSSPTNLCCWPLSCSPGWELLLSDSRAVFLLLSCGSEEGWQRSCLQTGGSLNLVPRRRLEPLEWQNGLPWGPCSQQATLSPPPAATTFLTPPPPPSTD